MAHRHKVQLARGGTVVKSHKMPDVSYGNQDVINEAREHKRGGKAKMHGKKAHHRLDKRARGGGVGSDKAPFSSAHIKGTAPAHNPAAHKHGGHAGK